MRALVIALLCAGASSADERLVLLGGGARPPEALSRFSEWAGGRKARILVIAWASSEPAESFDSLRDDFAPYRPDRMDLAPMPPLGPGAKADLSRQLERATGVFFSGGDQGRIMDVLRDQSLQDALRARYAAGVVFGGTSAGTACMSSLMITGDGDFTVIDADSVGVRAGLGLLPNVILDQHFIKRQRQNRLFGLILRHPGRLGLGIDEGSAMLVRDNRHAEVVGESPVMVVDGREERGALVVQLLRPGDRFDIKKRKRVRHGGQSPD
ncbi:MAG TPA: cyanophycinase [Vicinamibacteria bacterium]|nr:cyanophycinase [Vicinamibacteria bacterium]